MNLPRLQSLVAPVTTPAAPAVLLANELYRAMLIVQIDHYIALFTSIVAIVGIEFSGALMCYNAIEAWRRRSWLPMILAIAGAIIYAIIVIAGVATMPEQRGRVFGVMVLLTLVAYLAYAIFTSFDKQDAANVQDTTLAIQLADAQRKLANAQTRQSKASIDAKPVSTVSTGQTGQPQITEIGQKVIAYFTEHPAASLRTVSAEVGCSPETVRQWKQVWEANK